MKNGDFGTRRRAPAVVAVGAAVWGMAAICCLALRALPEELDPAAPVREITVVQWNVNNLFDTVDDPANAGDDPYAAGGWEHWSENRYRTKLARLAEILDALGGDVVCLQEVENRRVLEDLAAKLRSAHGRDYAHIIHREGPDHRGIDVAILSTIPPATNRWLTPVPLQRDILVSGFDAGGARVTVMVNHWKSWLGARNRTARMRMAQARAAAGELGRLIEADPRAAVVMAGDFNDDFNGPSLVDGAGSLPDIRAVLSDSNGRSLYNLHAGLPREAAGTVFYRQGKRWNTFDSISVSRSMVAADEAQRGWRVEPGSYEVCRLPRLLDEQGYPKAFRRVSNSETGRREYVLGYSDHLPVRVVLTLDP